jgi:hypothetical protein
MYFLYFEQLSISRKSIQGHSQYPNQQILFLDNSRVSYWHSLTPIPKGLTGYQIRT